MLNKHFSSYFYVSTVTIFSTCRATLLTQNARHCIKIYKGLISILWLRKFIRKHCTVMELLRSKCSGSSLRVMALYRCKFALGNLKSCWSSGGKYFQTTTLRKIWREKETYLTDRCQVSCNDLISGRFALLHWLIDRLIDWILWVLWIISKNRLRDETSG